MTPLSDQGPPLSVPVAARAARPLTEIEWVTIELIADALIPMTNAAPAASAETDFRERLVTALDARDDAFDAIVAVLAVFRDVPSTDTYERLRSLDRDNSTTFQALSTVVAGAWLLTPGVRERIGYRGLTSNRAGLEEAADELASGVLDPVIERHRAGTSKWIR